MDWNNGKYSFIGIPISLGGRFSGAQEGPKALFNALGIPESLIQLTSVHLLDQYERKSKQQIDAVKSICSEVIIGINSIYNEDKIPVIFGGDHSLSICTFSAYFSRYEKNLGEIGIIYIDAHPDIHTPQTSFTQNIHGMVLGAACLPNCGYIDEMRGISAPKISTSAVCFLGIRDIDTPEQEVISKNNIFSRTSYDILKSGASICVKQAADHLKAQGVSKVIVSFDIDILEMSLAPASGLPVKDGIFVGDVLAMFEIINREFEVIAYEFVEFAPIRDTPDKITEKNYVEIIQKALGVWL